MVVKRRRGGGEGEDAVAAAGVAVDHLLGEKEPTDP